MKMYHDLKLVVNDFKGRTKGARRFLTPETQRALVALCIVDLMKVRAEHFPNKPMGPYTDTFEDACSVLGISEYE